MSDSLWVELAKIFINNPQLLIAVMCLVGMYLIVTKFGRSFIASQQAIATSIAQQAGAVATIGDILNRIVIEMDRDHKEFRIELRSLVLESQNLNEKIDSLQCVKLKPKLCFAEHIE